MGLSDPATTAVRKLNRNIAIAGTVVLFHIAALWALQAGLLRRVVEIVVPVAILSETITPPAPKVEPPAPPPVPKQPEPVSHPVAKKLERVPPAAPEPVAVPDSRPAPNAPTIVIGPQPALPPIAAPVGEPGPSADAGSTGKVELPSSEADYLQNPEPVFPPISKRLGEQGKVVVRVLIGADGMPQRAELKRSSGYDRLDRAAIEYVMRCRYVPGKVGGVPQAMWYEAPVNFVLQ